MLALKCLLLSCLYFITVFSERALDESSHKVSDLSERDLDEFSHIVFLEVSIGDKPIGNITLGLYGDDAPLTVNNFLHLVSHTNGYGYKNSTFHRVIKQFMIQGGDFTAGDGTGGKSVYGAWFPDEKFIHDHSKPMVLSMANAGRDTNGSQFFITTIATPWLNKKHVVFGRVITGEDVVRKVENVPVAQGNNKPLTPVIISNCGVLEGELYSSSDVDAMLFNFYSAHKEL